jgi:hypothetical protein
MDGTPIVYVLTNSAMPGLVKIGRTQQSAVELRMNQLYSTGVPVPFECIYAAEVDDHTKVEAALHIAFGPSRVNQNREFFKIDPEQAVAVLKLIGNKEVTPQVNADLNIEVSEAELASGKKLQKKPNLNFAQMGIPIESQLLFKDNVSFVEVVGEKKVKLNGVMMSLTAATRDLLGIDYSVQPSPHWTFQGKSLKDIYDQVYSDGDD